MDAPQFELHDADMNMFGLDAQRGKKYRHDTASVHTSMPMKFLIL